MRQYLTAGLVVFTAAACALQRADTARQAQSQLVGMSSEQVLACMGIPANRATLGETEVWEYGSGNGQQTLAAAGNANGNFATASGVARQRFCKIDLVMRGGLVQTVNYSGPTGGLITQGEQCAYAVQNCVKH